VRFDSRQAVTACNVVLRALFITSRQRYGGQHAPLNTFGGGHIALRHGLRRRRGGSSSGLVSITVSPANPSVKVGATQQLSATGMFSDGRITDLTGSVAWTTSAPSSATVDANTGLVHAIAVGPTTITATSGGAYGEWPLRLLPDAKCSWRVYGVRGANPAPHSPAPKSTIRLPTLGRRPRP
jgi:hypothetical protein